MFFLINLSFHLFLANCYYILNFFKSKATFPKEELYFRRPSMEHLILRTEAVEMGQLRDGEGVLTILEEVQSRYLRESIEIGRSCVS